MGRDNHLGRPAILIDAVHQELKRASVTLMLRWEEYARDNPLAYKFTSFFLQEWDTTLARRVTAARMISPSVQWCRILERNCTARFERGLPKKSSLVASSTISPRSMKITRWATLRAKPISWVTHIMVMPS